MSKIKFAKHHNFSQYTQMMARMPEDPQVIKNAKKDGKWHGWMADLRQKDLSHFDLSAYDPMDFDWDTLTKWPSSNKIPKGFNHKKVLETMKDPGLGVRYLHSLGLTGKGLNMAIIDARLPDHQEYHNNITLYEEFGDFSPEPEGSMHGAAVASIAVGKTVGVAPEAKLYYFAEQNILYETDKNGKPKLTFQNVVNSINRILQINETLPKDKKIQVISLSWNTVDEHEYLEQMRAAVQKCKDAGIFLNSTSCSHDYGLKSHGLCRDIFKDPNDVSAYSAPDWGAWHASEKTLYFPMEHRTTAAPQGYTDYTHYALGGWSWKQPFESALFLLARQINPTITPEHFWEIGLKTAFKRKGINIINPIKLVNVLSREMLFTLAHKKTLSADEKKHILNLKKWIKGTDRTPSKRTRTKGLRSLRTAAAIQKKKIAERKGLKK